MTNTMIFLSFLTCVATTNVDVPRINKLDRSLRAGVDITRLTQEIKSMFRTELTRLKQDVRKYAKDELSQLRRRKQFGCQSGKRALGYSNPARSGRVTTHHITFNPPFADTPVITYGFVQIDTDKRTNVRLDAKIAGVSRKGFALVIVSWDVSLTYDVVVSWMACPRSK